MAVDAVGGIGWTYTSALTEQAGDMPGDGSPQGRSRASERDNDPLGRPTRSRDYSDGRVKVPTADESAVQRARSITRSIQDWLV